MKRKVVSILIAVLVCAFVFTACNPASPAESPSPSQEAGESPTAPSEEPAPPEEPSPEESPSEAPVAADNSSLNIQVIAKGFQHAFWQTVKKGSEDAAAELGVGTMNFVGPEGESAINTQVEMLNAALSAQPNAIALAALDTKSVTSQLEQALTDGIPVIGFDSGVPDAPAGSILATAATDNRAAAALAADEMMKDAAFSEKVKAATPDNPVTVAVLSQDATSASVTQRTEGFVEEFSKLAEELFPGAVAVEGHDLYKKDAANPAAVKILVQIPPTTDATDLKNAAQAVLNAENLIGIFCSNEGTVGGLLNATNDGADLDKDNGKYKDLTVAGFDAGSTQKAAVKNGWFLGSVTQDPYQIGYQAVDLCVKAAKGEPVADLDTGAKWYNASNMDEPDIAQLLYD